MNHFCLAMSFFFSQAWVAESNNHCSHLSFTSAACWASNSSPRPSALPLQIKENSSSSHVWRGLNTGSGIQEAISQWQLLFFTFFMRKLFPISFYIFLWYFNQFFFKILSSTQSARMEWEKVMLSLLAFEREWQMQGVLAQKLHFHSVHERQRQPGKDS